jgi:hypothetical protein
MDYSGYWSAAKRALLVREIRRLRRQVREADKCIRPFIVGLSEALDGVEIEVFDREVRELLA